MIGKLGRRPPKNAPALRLSSILTGVVPVHPVAADHLSRVRNWSMLGNDQYGDCGPVSVANSRALTTLYLTDTEHYPTLDDVFDLYRRSGNPNFDPETGVDDNGVVMQDMLDAVHKGGIAGTTCVAYAKVDVSNLDEVRAAISIFGYLLLGVDLQAAQQQQTDSGLWDYQRSSEWGGHAVLAGSYTSASTGRDLAVVTWAEVVGLTDSFCTHQCEEAWVLIWPEHLGSEAFQEGVDLASLADAYKALTGRVLPIPDPPTPEPDPAPAPPAPTPDPVPVPPDPPAPTNPDAPTPADKDLWDDIHRWAYGYHIWSNAKAARRVVAWAKEKGLANGAPTRHLDDPGGESDLPPSRMGRG